MDDGKYLITKPELRPVSGLVSLWIEPQTTKQYHPLVDTLFWLGNRLWGNAVLGYHLVNIALHSISALMLWKILRRLEVAGAWLAAAVFALHPAQVDSVAWLAEAKNTLSGLFFVGCILAYLRFDRTRTRGAYVLALFLFGLGLLAKAIVAMAPVSLAILFWWKRGRFQWKRDLRPLIPFGFVGIAAGFATAWMERKFSGAEGEAFAFSFVERLLIAGRSFWFYLTKSLWPSNLSFVYPRWEINSHIWWQYAFPVAAICFFVLAWSLRKRWPWLFAGLLIFGAILLPMLGFFNVTFFNYSFVSDHFQYLAILGVIVPVSAGGATVLARLSGAHRVAGHGFVFALLGTLAVLTSRHSEMYRDVETCSRMVLEKNPNHWPTRNNLGAALLQKGDLDEAMACFEIALQESPRSKAQRHIYRNIGDIFSRKGQLDEAIAQFEKCLAMAPDFAEAHHDLANALRRKGRYHDAIAHYESALRIDPRSVLTMNNLGWILATCPDPSVRNGAKAVEIAARAERLSGGEDPLILHTLAAACAENGRFTQAVATAERALQFAKRQRKDFLVRALAREIALYRTESPYHELSP